MFTVGLMDLHDSMSLVSSGGAATIIHRMQQPYWSPASVPRNLLGLTYSAMPSSWWLGEFLGRRS
jgi:hypothetical protein